MTLAFASMDTPRQRRCDDPIVVIGGGFSGTVAAVRLSQALPESQPILLCERGARTGFGVAYGTRNPQHLLNVRATNMGAFAKRPDDFSDWLALQSGLADDLHETQSGTFASRRLYGAYLRARLCDALAAKGGQLRLMHTEIDDCVPKGDGYELQTTRGARIRVRGVVLATGQFSRAQPGDPRFVADPWSPAATAGLDPAKPVLLLGTGLTMIDVVMSLRLEGFRGPIVALSRHGLLPQSHGATEPWTTPGFSQHELQSVSLVARRLRHEVAAARARGVDWRSVVDSVRPLASAIWQNWSDEARARFLRHARSWWDTHRHRMAPPNAATIASEMLAGSLTVVAGHVRETVFGRDTIHVRYRPRGGAALASLDVQRVIAATGFECARSGSDPLIRRLLERGTARLDPLGMGLDVTPDLEVVGANGRVRHTMWALGPLVRGVFWECTAVPDIREQTERLAALVPVAAAA